MCICSVHFQQCLPVLVVFACTISKAKKWGMLELFSLFLNLCIQGTYCRVLFLFLIPSIYLYSVLCEALSQSGCVSFQALTVRSWIRCILQMYIKDLYVADDLFIDRNSEQAVGKYCRCFAI